jgi:DNA-binding MarR family transcriptional regulator
MATFDARHVWALNYRLLVRVIDEVTAPVAELGLDTKELFLLDRVDECPYPADLARQLRWPKPTVTFTVKRVEQKGFLRREIDSADLRRHRLILTPAGRKAMTRGMLLVVTAYEQRLSRLTRAEQASLGAMLEKMS